MLSADCFENLRKFKKKYFYMSDTYNRYPPMSSGIDTKIADEFRMTLKDIRFFAA